MPGVDFEPLDWVEEFLPWFCGEDGYRTGAWRPGEHVAVIAPTGAGKTTFVRGLLEGSRYVLAFDPKGGDDTLEGFGYPRLNKWPGDRAMSRTLQDNDENGRPTRFIVGPKVRTKLEKKTRLRPVLRDALVGAHDMGGWTIYADELQLLTDPRMHNLRADVDEILVSARNWGLSFVSSYQAPSWVTPHASKMATWCAVSYTRDTDVVDRLAEVLGRPKKEVRGGMEGAGEIEYSWLVVGRNPREPMRVTIPDYVAPKLPEGVA